MQIFFLFFFFSRKVAAHQFPFLHRLFGQHCPLFFFLSFIACLPPIGWYISMLSIVLLRGGRVKIQLGGSRPSSQ